MKYDTFFEELEAVTAPQRENLQHISIVSNSLEGNVSLSDYYAFLSQAYHHVKHTVPLLMACGSRLPERLEWLREAVAEYIEEEIGHQRWILNDIEHIGGDRDAVEHGLPALSTDLMVSYAYDTVTRKNPVGLFGMVYVLEKTSSTIATAAANQISTKLELPQKAMSYMISHGSLDIEHMESFEKLMNQLTNPEDKQAVIDTAVVMYELYGGIFKQLPELAAQLSLSNKAA